MTSATAVGQVWDVELAERSLPGGMPLSIQDETPIIGRARNILVREQPELGDWWFDQPVKELSERRWTTPEELEELNKRHLELVLTLQASTTGILSANVERRIISDATLFETIEQVKEALSIDWDPLLEVLGFARRTFFTYRTAKIIPADRFLAVRIRLALIQREISTGVESARMAIDLHHADLRQALDVGDMARARAVFASCRTQVAEARQSAFENAKINVATQLRQLADVVAHPRFGDALAAATALFEKTDVRTGDRMRAVIELDQAIADGHSGADLDEQWTFLATLTHADIDAFKAAATTYIYSAEFSWDGWQSLIEAESERAWDNYQVVLLPPDPADALYPDDEPVDNLFSTLGFVPYSQRVVR